MYIYFDVDKNEYVGRLADTPTKRENLLKAHITALPGVTKHGAAYFINNRKHGTYGATMFPTLEWLE